MLKKLQNTIKKDNRKLTFIFGNGINHYYNSNSISWNELLLTIWNQFNIEKRKEIPEGINITEFYDAIDLIKGNSGQKHEIQHHIKDIMKQWTSSDKVNHMLDKAISLDVPIITTNFDDLMSKYLGLSAFRTLKKGFTDYYPWDTYYAKGEIEKTAKRFSIWHLNGMIKYHRSIKLGLSHYMGNVERAKNQINKKPNGLYFTNDKEDLWNGTNSWLQLFINNSIIIVGLGLEEVEVFVRWLLIERKKYFNHFPSRRQDAYYITLDSEKSNGKELFLDAVGVKSIYLNSFKEIYEDLWKF